MAGLELEQLLAPVSEASPAGEDLQYDPRFMELERASTREPTRYSGKEEIPGKEPDWKIVQQIATELLSRTKDLRVSVRLASAATVLEGLPGLAAGIALNRGLVERYWDTVHPLLDPEDANDPVFRTNALATLASSEGLLGIVRNTYLVESRALGRFSFRDLDIAEQRITIQAAPDAKVPTPEVLLSALKEVGPDYVRERKVLLEAARADLRATDAAFATHAPGAGPNFEPLDKTLGYAIDFLAKGLPAEQAVALEEGPGEAGAGA